MLKHIELDSCEIYYYTNDYEMNNRSQNFYLHQLSI